MPRDPIGSGGQKKIAKSLDYYRIRFFTARATKTMSDKDGAVMFGITKHKVRYWRRKMSDAEFKPGNHGNRRYEKMTSSSW